MKLSGFFAVITLAALLSDPLVAQETEGKARVFELAPKPADSDEFSGRTMKSMNDAMALITRRHRSAPLPGQMAPPFELLKLGSDEKVALASLHREKPLVLLFTSYQCDVFVRGWSSFLKVYQANKERLNFAMIYIREAHATDGILFGNPKFEDPKSMEQRLQMASLCQKTMKIPFPILVDEITDQVATRWGAWPIRMVVIKKDGTVGYTSINGPFGFRPGHGFLHGDGESATNNADRGYNEESLEEYLASMFDSEKE
jgi:hypothetical protein